MGAGLPVGRRIASLQSFKFGGQDRVPEKRLGDQKSSRGPGPLGEVKVRRHTYHLKDGIFGTVALTRDHTSAPNQTSSQIVNNVPIEIGHHKHIKLVRILHQLRNKKWA